MISAAELGQLTGFDDQAPTVIDALARRAVEVDFAADETIFRAGSAAEGWFIVLEGTVRVVRAAGSRQHVIHTEAAGGSLGEVPLVEGGTYPATAIASEPTRCALLTRAALETAIQESPAVAFLLARRLARRVRLLVDRLDDRSARSVRVRLIEFLLSRRAGLVGRAGGDASISIGMTQDRLAEELGTVREVVARELRALVRRGWIASLGGGRYRLIDARSLRAAARDDGDSV